MVVRLFSFSYKWSSFLLSIFEGKVKTSITKPDIFNCFVFLHIFTFFITYFSTGTVNPFITLIAADTINVIINMFVTFKTWIVRTKDPYKSPCYSKQVFSILVIYLYTYIPTFKIFPNIISKWFSVTVTY